MTQTLRKKPTQDRSKQRVERILDAAARIFADVGYAAATTEAIAERAGVSIGSLYQFFPNKRALFDAVGAQYLAEARKLFDTFITRERTQRPWQELLDETVDAFWVFQRTSPGFQAVYKSFLLSKEFFVAGDMLNREIASRLEAVIARYSSISRTRREIVATVIVETLSAMMLVGVRMREPRATNLQNETKLLLRRYLEPYVDRKT